MKGVALLVLWLCAGQAAEPLRFESRHIKETLPGCGDAKNGCAHAEFTYLEAVSGMAQVRDRINARIHNFLCDRPAETPEQYAKRYVADYKANAKDLPTTWSLEKRVTVLRADVRLVSLEGAEWEFSGGAHPTSETEFLNFDAATGEELLLDSILKEGALPRLTAIAERYFRKVRQLAPDADLQEAGFSFSGNRFQLNRNFGLTDKALVFEYNSYEVAPGAEGATRIEIPLTEIRELLQ